MIAALQELFLLAVIQTCGCCIFTAAARRLCDNFNKRPGVICWLLFLCAFLTCCGAIVAYLLFGYGFFIALGGAI